MRRWLLIASFLTAVSAPVIAQETGPEDGALGADALLLEAASCGPRPGPLAIRGHSLFQIATIDFVPDAPIALPARGWEIHLSTTWINVFNYDPEKYLIDGEFVRAGATLWYGVSDDLQVAVTVPVEYIGGGVMDHLIMGFHDAFGLGQAGRDEFEEDRFAVTVGGEERPSETGAYLGDVMLSSVIRLIEMTPDRVGLAMGLKIKLPTATQNPFHETDALGAGVTACAFYAVDRYYFYAGASFSFLGQTEVIGEPLNGTQSSVLLSVERRFGDSVSVVAQLLGQSPIADDFHEFSRWTAEVSVGVKVQLSDRMYLQCAVLENLFRFDNSPDFGVHFGIVIQP